MVRTRNVLDLDLVIVLVLIIVIVLHSTLYRPQCCSCERESTFAYYRLQLCGINEELAGGARRPLEHPEEQ